MADSRIPRTRLAFRAAVHKGLGRAVMALRRGYPAAFDGEILDAALHWRGENPLFEGYRSRYLCELVTRSRRATYIRQRIISALASTRRTWAAEQLCYLVGRFAERGDSVAAEALRRRFTRRSSIDDDTVGIQAYLWVDRLRALKTLAARLKRGARGGWIVACATRSLGKRRVEAAARSDPAIARLLRSAAKPQSRTKRRHESYSAMKARAMRLPSDPGIFELASFERWGWRATARQRRRAAKDLTRLKAPGATMAFLKIALADAQSGRFDAFSIAALLHHAKSRHAWVARFARRCLSFAVDPRVRNLALLQIRTRRWDGDDLAMLARNYLAGDESALEACLPDRPTPEVAQRIVSKLLLFLATKPPPPTSGLLRWYHRPELATPGLLRWSYEHAHSGFTRAGIVKWLIRRRCAPLWLLHECTRDSYDETRRLAGKTLSRRRQRRARA